MDCPECGYGNSADSRHCISCGAPLSGATAGARRQTQAEAGLFEGRPPPPPPRPANIPPAHAPRKTTNEQQMAQPGPQAASGRRRTVLEGDGDAPAPRPSPQPVGYPAAKGGSPGARSRTVLDEPDAAVAGPATPQRAAGGGRAPRVVGWMVSFNFNAAGQHYVICEGRNRIGRARDNDVSLYFDARVSEHHATIIYRRGKTAVKDEASTHGTLVNGEDVGIGEVQPLNSGDTLEIGGCKFMVFLLSLETTQELWPELKAM